MRTVLSYWTAPALGAYEMSLLTVEVKVFITRRRRPHSPSSGRGITSLRDSRDGLWRHLFEVRFYCNWSHLPHSHKSLRARFLKHVGGISILTAFLVSSRHGLRGADAKAVSCELYICNCQRHAEAQELETTNTYWLTHCSGFRVWVRGDKIETRTDFKIKAEKKRRHGTLYVSHEGTDWASHSTSSFLWWEWKGKRNALCRHKWQRPLKRAIWNTGINTGALPSNQTSIHVVLRRKV